MKTSKITDLELVIARQRAERNTNLYINKNGEHPFNCGFAWVVVKGVRGNNSKMLQKHGFKKRYDGPGLSLWNPSNNMTQDMSAKMAGAEKYAETLRDMGLDAQAYCRLD